MLKHPLPNYPKEILRTWGSVHCGKRGIDQWGEIIYIYPDLNLRWTQKNLWLEIRFLTVPNIYQRMVLILESLRRKEQNLVRWSAF